MRRRQWKKNVGISQVTEIGEKVKKKKKKQTKKTPYTKHTPPHWRSHGCQEMSQMTGKTEVLLLFLRKVKKKI